MRRRRIFTPFVVAANGPKGMRLALEQGDAWVTTTGAPPDADADAWWAAAADKAARFEEVVAAQDPDALAGSEGFARYLNLEARTAGFGVSPRGNIACRSWWAVRTART